jgi:seryl-tRNA synthetase
MLDLKHVVEHLEEVQRGLARRNADAAALLNPMVELQTKRKDAIHKSEKLAAQRNAANQDMAKLPKGSAEFLARRDELKAISSEQKELEKLVQGADGEIKAILEGVPNVPHAGVPDGHEAANNREEKVWGSAPSFDFQAKPHWEIGESLGILDFERAAKLSGSRFTVMMGAGARLERALIQLMLNIHTEEHGYTEVLPPFLVKDSALYGVGQLPKFEADVFKTHNAHPERGYDLYLIPTAEAPLTNLFAGEILEADALPISYTAYTPCFRSEAGSHGRDVRGMIRQHQFDKIELVKFATPEQAEAEHEALTSHAEAILERLGLHYRRMLLCAGDMGFSSHKTYDLEVFLPSHNEFREISSCSWFHDFQARRANIRFRPEPKAKPQFVHTINGSGLAVGRTVVAILEQYQQADGSVKVPDALLPYMGGLEVIKKALYFHRLAKFLNLARWA